MLSAKSPIIGAAVKVVADCNTYISGLLFKGPPSEFLRQAQLGKFQLYIFTPILNEIVGVLGRKKLLPAAAVLPIAIPA